MNNNSATTVGVFYFNVLASNLLILSIGKLSIFLSQSVNSSEFYLNFTTFLL